MECPPVAIDRFKELMIVEPSVVGDARARNDIDGPWSFRHVMETLAGPGGDPVQLTLDWVLSFSQEVKVNSYSTSQRPRVTAMITCPWLQSRPENACNTSCDSCKERTLDLSRAPFRLLAISNRIDVHRTEGGAGEGRLVFGLVDGPADDPSRKPMDMTVVFEFDLGAGLSAPDWARRWHALGKHTAFDDAFRAELESLTAGFVARDQLSQARTNERVLDWDWQMREYRMAGGKLVPSQTLQTPDKSLNGAPAVAQFVKQNESDVRAGVFSLPPTMMGAEVPGGMKWVVPGVAEDLRRAFAKNTCNGCHQTEERPIDFAFHVSPYKKGVESLSPFINNPADPSSDDLGARTKVMQGLLCK